MSNNRPHLSVRKKAKVSIIRDNQAIPVIQGHSAQTFMERVDMLNKMARKIDTKSVVERMKSSTYGKAYSQVKKNFDK